jgi:hypothetical protein
MRAYATVHVRRQVERWNIHILIMYMYMITIYNIKEKYHGKRNKPVPPGGGTVVEQVEHGGFAGFAGDRVA